CYNFQPLTDVEVFVTFGQKDNAGLYCYYSNWDCYGEEICIENDGTTLVPVSDDIKKTGIRSTLIKKHPSSTDEQYGNDIPKDAISWVY
ncbi:hypothetical protein K7432_017409, partial [Basidiobolus ranarum]